MNNDCDIKVLVDKIDLTKVSKQQHKLMAQRIKEIRQHFKKDKWDLGYSGLIEDLSNTLLGFSLEGLLFHYLRKEKLVLRYQKAKLGEFVLARKTRRGK